MLWGHDSICTALSPKESAAGAERLSEAITPFPQLYKICILYNCDRDAVGCSGAPCRLHPIASALPSGHSMRCLRCAAIQTKCTFCIDHRQIFSKKNSTIFAISKKSKKALRQKEKRGFRLTCITPVLPPCYRPGVIFTAGRNGQDFQHTGAPVWVRG